MLRVPSLPHKNIHYRLCSIVKMKAVLANETPLSENLVYAFIFVISSPTYVVLCYSPRRTYPQHKIKKMYFNLAFNGGQLQLLIELDNSMCSELYLSPNTTLTSPFWNASRTRIL